MLIQIHCLSPAGWWIISCRRGCAQTVALIVEVDCNFTFPVRLRLAEKGIFRSRHLCQLLLLWLARVLARCFAKESYFLWLRLALEHLVAFAYTPHKSFCVSVECHKVSYLQFSTSLLSRPMNRSPISLLLYLKSFQKDIRLVRNLVEHSLHIWSKPSINEELQVEAFPSYQKLGCKSLTCISKRLV